MSTGLRVLACLVGFGSACLVIWLGFAAVHDTGLVVWFGIACAFVAPTSLALIGFAVRGGSERRSLARLSKVPEIERLIAQAESESDRIAALEKQRWLLEDIIRYESRRQAVRTERERLHEEALEATRRIEWLDSELERLGEAAPPVSAEVAQLRAELDRAAGDRGGGLVLQVAGYRLRVDSALLPFPLGVVISMFGVAVGDKVVKRR